jgi:hypothetical protein
MKLSIAGFLGSSGFVGAFLKNSPSSSPLSLSDSIMSPAGAFRDSTPSFL